MDDRELLEMAAKAAGIDLRFSSRGDAYVGTGLYTYRWNPLAGSDDSLNLQVALYLDVYFYRGFEQVVVQGEGTPDTPTTLGEKLEVREPFGRDIPAATRRAIVRAAAEIGRSMP